MPHCQTREFLGKSVHASPCRPPLFNYTRIQATICWEDEDTPRLRPTDLDNPILFHKRLNDWLLRQK